MKYEFADCLLDSDRHQLFRAGEPVKTEPQVFDLLHLLVGNPGLLLTRDRIIDTVWQGRIVSESTVSARINAARKAVGDTGKKQAIIKTIARRGIQMVAEVTFVDKIAPSPAEGRQQIRFVKSQDGSQIAYASSGSGPNLMRAGHFLTHLEMDWQNSIWRPLLDRLGADHRLIRYDQRGSGLSEPKIKSLTLQDYSDDLKAVADASGLDRFPIFAMSQGVPAALHFAAHYPERVSHLVLYGGYVNGRAIRDGEQTSSEATTLTSLMQLGWGKPDSAFMGAFTSVFAPDADPEQIAGLVKMQLASCTAENAITIRNAIDRFSVSDLLGKVQAPTLVLHARNDSVHPVSEAQKLAGEIPNAELITLESNNHITLPGTVAWDILVDSTLEFLARD